MGMAIAGEAICGLVYGSQPLLYAVISEILPRKYRPAAQGGINASLGLGGLTALLAGSTMIKKYTEGFRVFWYLVAGILAVSATIFAILYNPPARPLQKSLTTKEKLRRLDWMAYFLLATGTVLFVIALSWAENPYPWRSAAVLALQVAFAASFRNVWIAAAALAGVATIGEFYLFKHSSQSGEYSDMSLLASCFFAEPKTITMHVDAPLDEE
jgi:MFS family permease